MIPYKPTVAPLMSAIAVACVMALAPDRAAAQAAAPAASGSGEAQTITVTANKRREAQREVAGTVSAVRGEELEASGARDMEDVFRLTPGVQVNKGDPDQSLPTVRGIATVVGNKGLGLQQATTGIYVEDVPCTDPIGLVATCDLSPFDLERVEVLRGPQGVLFGSASLGGAVRYVLAKPDVKSRQFRLSSSVAGVSQAGTDFSNHAMMNLPLGDGAVRVVLGDSRDSGTVRNAGTKQDHADSVHQRGGRILGGFKFGPGVRLNLVAMNQRTNIDDSSAVDDPSSRVRNTPTASPRTTEVSLYNATLEADIGPMVLTSVTGVLDKTNRSGTDFTRRAGDLGKLLGLPLLPLVTSQINFESRTQTQELRLASSTKDSVSWMAGAFYQHTRFTNDTRMTAPGGATLWGAAKLPNDLYLAEIDNLRSIERAVFADVEWRPNPFWSASAGVRHYENDSHVIADVRLIEAILGRSQYDVRKSESGNTPRLTVKYTGLVVWYATVSQGYRFGGVNVASGKPYNTDKLWNYETGVRFSPARQVDLDATVFQMDWKDAQVNARQPGPVPINGIANVGKARVSGAELTAAWRVVPGTRLDYALALIDARTAAAFTSNNGSIVASGTRMPGTPKTQGTLRLSHDFEGPWGTSGRWQSSFAHVGDRTLSLDLGGVAPSYTQLDSQVSLSKYNWELVLFGRNLGNRAGVVGGAPVATFGGSKYNEYLLTRPRTVGVSLRLEL